MLFPIFVLAIAIIGFTSCEKEEMNPMDEAQIENGLKKRGGPPADKPGAPAPGEFSIAEIAINEGFSELVAALGYVDEELDAGLVDLFLNGTDQYTVFAPTNLAFADLYSAASSALGADIDEITDLPAELVLNVLLYHVTEGRRASNSVVPPKKPRTIETLLGETFSVNSDLEITAIGSTANLVPSFVNISASNGIIHVIDTVLLPIEL